MVSNCANRLLGGAAPLRSRSFRSDNIHESERILRQCLSTLQPSKAFDSYDEYVSSVSMTSVEDALKEETQTEGQPFAESSTIDRNSRCESPKRGTTLSTSTSSFEALDPHDPNLSRLANTMFQKTGEYLQEELTATHADYRLLERLNKETIAKYTELKTISSNVAQSLDSLNEKYKKLQPILDNINEIDDSVSKLEQAAYKLAAYSKRLEAKFKDIEKDTKNK